MADSERDQAMRLVGQLLGAVNMLEQISIPPQRKRPRELLQEGQRLVNKAMLAMWEEADLNAPQHSGKHDEG